MNKTTDKTEKCLGYLWIIGAIVGVILGTILLLSIIYSAHSSGISNVETTTVQVEIVDTEHHNTGFFHMPQYLKEYEVAVRYKDNYYSVYIDNADDFYTYKNEIGKQVSATLETTTHNDGSTSLAITKIGE